MILNKNKKLIQNPDEYIVSCISDKKNSNIEKITNIDNKRLLKIINQFDLKSVSNFLAHLPATKALSLFSMIPKSKQEMLLEFMPSHSAAKFISHNIKQKQTT